ncbi:MAG: 2-oxoacid:acceptor oxidoreductase subunit alpha [Prevotella sp.]|nr:2-oxoacid:acceptor oxidoreductase subunit alpha [Prevotella sp.]
MTEEIEIKELSEVVVRFSGDSGDGMQLAGNIFSTISATVGNGISTFPDYPADIRAPQGSLTGVSGFQVHIGSGPVYTPGDQCDVLVAMNAAALKTQYKYAKPQATIIIDTDSFGAMDLKKADFKTDDYLAELGIDPDRVVACPITQMVKAIAADSTDSKTALKCRNMFALGLVCWLFNREVSLVENFLREKFARKPQVAELNIKVVNAGYDYGHNVHASVPATYRIESKTKVPGRYMDITGNKATAYGLIAAAEKAGLKLFLGSYPITPATDILHELSKHKSCGVITVQCEDEISGCASAVGAAFAGALAATSTSGPGICLKSEAINLAVIDELPLVIIDVQRGGPSTGLPTKSEQTDLLQALYGRNGESPMPIIAATSPTDCFDAAYRAAKMALEHMTPVILLTDAFIANGSAAWKLPKMDELPDIRPHYVTDEQKYKYTPYVRDPESQVRYWAIPGQEGYTHILGGLEKDGKTGAISTEPENHNKMSHIRYQKVARIPVPDLVVEGDADDAELLIVGFGSTYGHLLSATNVLRSRGHKVAMAQVKFVNPLPANIAEVLMRYPKVVVAEQNLGQLAALLRIRVNGFAPYQYNQVKGQPFVVNDLVEEFERLLETKAVPSGAQTFDTKVLNAPNINI